MSYPRRSCPTTKLIAGRFSLYTLLYLLPVFCYLFLLLATPGFSTPMGWVATYGDIYASCAHCIQQTSDGGYIVAGERGPFGAEDAWVLKLKPDGAVEWQKTYGGVRMERAYSIHEARDGGYVVAGFSGSFGAGWHDLWVVKLGPDGDVEWQKTYGGGGDEWANSIHETQDGGYVVTGWSRSFCVNKEDNDLWVLKLGQDGTIEWQKTYGGADYDKGSSIQQTRDGGYIVAGDTRSFGAGAYDLWILKLRPDGTIEWQKTYGGKYDEWPGSIQETSDGGYIVACSPSSFEGDAWVLKLGQDGTVEWQKIYGIGDEGATSIQQTQDGGYIVAGWVGPSFNKDVLVFKLGFDGIVEWQKAYGGEGGEWARCIQQTRDGGYIVAGWAGLSTSEGIKEAKFLVMRVKPDGSIDPHCDLVWDIFLLERRTIATIQTTNVSPKDSNGVQRDSLATARDTDASARFLCP